MAGHDNDVTNGEDTMADDEIDPTNLDQNNEENINEGDAF